MNGFIPLKPFLLYFYSIYFIFRIACNPHYLKTARAVEYRWDLEVVCFELDGGRPKDSVFDLLNSNRESEYGRVS